LSKKNTQRAASFENQAEINLQTGSIVVSVRGSDSLLVIMEDGNEIFLMLGRERL